ncbi:ribosomal protein S18 [Candidatus Peregrinibacteria bacterium]|jgi:small subunit ribosomal protein S18|nr:ribosomal protein S18 [Candidatus Peregrinibacteria bacterium]
MKFVDSTKKCQICTGNDIILNYKNAPLLLQSVDYFGKIKKSYYQGTCRKHKKISSQCIKRSRHMGLLAFTR